MTDSESLKIEVLKLLSGVFGDEAVNLVDQNYDSKNPEELVEVAFHMLSGFMGDKNALKQIEELLKKFPKIKVRLQ